jgi:catechol 2,3-dioxygenase-like lactoylglutathione lyase family enzyme
VDDTSPPVPFVISYFTRDIPANRRFYGQVLGLELHSDLEDVYFLCGATGDGDYDWSRTHTSEVWSLRVVPKSWQRLKVGMCS